jgi:hypothetical protein
LKYLKRGKDNEIKIKSVMNFGNMKQGWQHFLTKTIDLIGTTKKRDIFLNVLNSFKKIIG